jgi:putative heme-binding domain-containing protein
MRFIKFLIFLAATAVLLAQHSYTPGDVRDGERLYLAGCAVCHGPDGNNVPGTDLGHGTFRRASTDEALVQIIRAGIPGTAMPPHNYSDFQAFTVVAFLHSLAASKQTAVATGDPAKGRAIFEGKGNCRSCHRIGAEGNRTGPDLTDIGANRRAAEIETSLVDPDAEILPQNRYVRVVARDGTATTGRLLNQDAFTVQIIDTKERLVSFRRADLKEFSFLPKSPMPSYRDKLTPAERADLVSYLVSLKGVQVQ